MAVTLTLLASTAMTFAIRWPAERFGPRLALVAQSVLIVVSALLFLATRQPWLVVVAAMIGNLAVGTGETGPFLALEQVIVTRATGRARLTMALAFYNLAGYAAAGLGAAAVTRAGAAPPLALHALPRERAGADRRLRAPLVAAAAVHGRALGSGHTLPALRAPPRGHLRPRLLRGRLRRAEPHRVLVPHALRSRAGRARLDLFRGADPLRPLSHPGRPPCPAARPGQHHDLLPPDLKPVPHRRRPRTPGLDGRGRSPRTPSPLADGRAHAPDVPHARRGGPRARARGGGDQPEPTARAVRHPRGHGLDHAGALAHCSLLPGRRAQDRLRRAALRGGAERGDEVGGAQRNIRRIPRSTRRGAITLATAKSHEGRKGYTSGRGRRMQRRIVRATCSDDWIGPWRPRPARRVSTSWNSVAVPMG